MKQPFSAAILVAAVCSSASVQAQVPEAIDFRFRANAQASHTSYQEGERRLRVRRGAAFEVSAPRGTVISALRLDFGGKWGTRVDVLPDGRVHRAQLPADLPIGAATLEVLAADGAKVLASQPIGVLFNPFSPADRDVFLDDAAARDAFVVSDHGHVWTPQGRQAWRFDQDDPNVLEATFELLEGLDVESRRSSVQVIRHLAHHVGTNVLHGRWDGDYSEGKPPWEWTSSAEIFALHRATKRPVRYGQCWVFAGTLTSLARAVGIPTRPVTNFQSAHERGVIDGTLDELWGTGASGALERQKSGDSIWNFHVWNEAWMSRPDLKSAPTWNAVDSTCQEMSDGRTQCGPASLAAIRAGRTGAAYDTDFIAGETNAVVRRLVRGEEGYRARDFRRHHSRVVDTEGNDVSAEYAPRVEKCLDPPAPQVEDVEVRISAPDAAAPGEPIAVTLELGNDAEQERTLLVSAQTHSVDGRGDIEWDVVARAEDPLRAAPRHRTTKRLLVPLPPGAWADGQGVELSVAVRVAETDQVTLYSRAMPFTMPKVNILCGRTVRVGEPVRCSVEVRNPLTVTLEQARLRVRGDGVRVQLSDEVELGALSAGATVRLDFEGVAAAPGAGVVNASLSTAELDGRWKSVFVPVRRAN